MERIVSLPPALKLLVVIGMTIIAMLAAALLMNVIKLIYNTFINTYKKHVKRNKHNGS